MSRRYTRAESLPQEEIAESYRQGVRARALSKRYGCSQSTILRVVKGQGVEMKLNRPLEMFDEAEFTQAAVDYEARRVSLRELGQRFGVSMTTIRRRLIAAGVEMHHPATRVNR